MWSIIYKPQRNVSVNIFTEIFIENYNDRGWYLTKVVEKHRLLRFFGEESY